MLVTKKKYNKLAEELDFLYSDVETIRMLLNAALRENAELRILTEKKTAKKIVAKKAPAKKVGNK